MASFTTAAALLLFYTGLRISECAALTLDDVRLSFCKGLVIVRMGEGNSYREVPYAGLTRTEEDFLAHGQAVVATAPEVTRWHFVCDNLNVHQSEALVRFVAECSGSQEDVGVKGKSGSWPPWLAALLF